MKITSQQLDPTTVSAILAVLKQTSVYIQPAARVSGSDAMRIACLVDGVEFAIDWIEQVMADPDYIIEL